MNLNRSALFSLEGKTALLTGASGFLGRMFAETLLMNGARVIVIGRSEKLLELAGVWSEIHGQSRVRACRVDMYDIAAFERSLDEIVAGEESIDILVNNAHELGAQTGFNVSNGALEEASYDQWMRNLTGGVYWAALTTQKIGRKMQSAKSGSIVNISTMYALVAPSPHLYQGTKFLNPPGYSASKAALLSFTRYTASFWGSYGIRANAMLPGPFSNTEEAGPNTVHDDVLFLDRLRARTCLLRIGRPAELAGALLFLASEASSYMTGQAMIVDGGWTVT
ncbi:MAG: SDR family oxidoreductase [Bryobacteraceae bacterium]